MSKLKKDLCNLQESKNQIMLDLVEKDQKIQELKMKNNELYQNFIENQQNFFNEDEFLYEKKERLQFLCNLGIVILKLNNIMSFILYY